MPASREVIEREPLINLAYRLLHFTAHVTSSSRHPPLCSLCSCQPFPTSLPIKSPTPTSLSQEPRAIFQHVMLLHPSSFPKA
ncbi:hypothetical protein BKA56DRAFT_576197 [Ilyonectria sp. MPI-CAGE-AT-0026]|nr:hypothetical protein BKA56DRAFT_576197 [Ilyonectria sp. MPI-CAGE-AT-0026]